VQAMRKRDLLEAAGWQVSLLGLSEQAPDGEPEAASLETVRDSITAQRPSVVLAIHALRSRVAVEAASQLGLPLVIATGGTDVVPGLEQDQSRELTCRAFGAADVILAQSGHQRGLIEQH